MTGHEWYCVGLGFHATAMALLVVALVASLLGFGEAGKILLDAVFIPLALRALSIIPYARAKRSELRNRPRAG